VIPAGASMAVAAVPPTAPAAGPAAVGGAAPCSPSFGQLLEARASRADPAAAASAPGPARIGAAALRALESIDAGRARLDGLLAAARGGRTFSPQELIALQSQAYRYAQTVELSAKLVEQGAQAVKHALNAQV